MKRFLSLTLAALMAVTALSFSALAAGGSSFSDVAADAWYAYCVEDTAERGLMDGTAEGVFTPDGELTRAMLVTVLWRLAGCPAPETEPDYSDVPGGQWYSDAIAWASGFQVVEGYGGRTFGPMDPVTREQMAVIFYRWAQGQKYDTTFTPCEALLREEANIRLFVWEADDEGRHGSSENAGKAVSEWAADAVLWAAEHDFLVRREVRGLDPYGGVAWYLCAPDTANRAEVAVFLSRFCRVYADGGDTAKVPLCPDVDNREQGGYRWDFLSLELPETWQGAYGMTTMGYSGVPDAFGLAFQDLSNYQSRTSGGQLFDLILWPVGKDSSRFGSWEKLGDAAPGRSGRLCTIQAPMGRLSLYVTYASDRYQEDGQAVGRLYDPDNPKNYLKMQAQIDAVLHSIRFREDVTVLSVAPYLSAPLYTKTTLPDWPNGDPVQMDREAAD